MEKSHDISGDEKDYSCELRNFELKFFAGSPPERFADLSEQELVCINLSKLVMHSGNFRENFSAISRQ